MGIAIDVQTGTTEGDTASQLDVLYDHAGYRFNVVIIPIDGASTTFPA